MTLEMVGRLTPRRRAAVATGRWKTARQWARVRGVRRGRWECGGVEGATAWTDGTDGLEGLVERVGRAGVEERECGSGGDGGVWWWCAVCGGSGGGGGGDLDWGLGDMVRGGEGGGDGADGADGGEGRGRGRTGGRT